MGLNFNHDSSCLQIKVTAEIQTKVEWLEYILEPLGLEKRCIFFAWCS